MKKLLFLLLCTVSIYGQTYLNPTYGTVKIKNNLATASTSKISSQDVLTGDLNYIDAANLPISTAAKTYSDTKLDLLNRFNTESTVISDGKYNAFPSIAKLTNKDLIVSYRKGVTHLTFDGSIILKRSTDNGITWGSESIIIAELAGHDYRDPSISQLANGNVIMSYFDRISPTNILIYTTISTDNGATFGTPVQLSGYADYGAVSSKVIQLVNGDLLLATYGKSGANGLLNVFKSTNNGASWSILSTISTDVFGSALKYTEPSLILLANGDILASIRNDSTIMASIATSTDNGATWSSVVDKFSSNSRATMCLQENRVILAYRTPGGNSAIRYTTDEGVTFSTEVQTATNLVGEQDEYSSMAVIDNNIIGYISALQNSASTASNISFKYLSKYIYYGDIPAMQTKGVISTGVSMFRNYILVNAINGLTGLDLTINTNTSNTTRDVILKAGNVEVFKAKGTGYGQFISRAGFGTPSPMNIIGANVPAGTGGGISLQNLAGNAEYARFGVVNPGTSNNSFVGSISNNNFSIYTNSTEKVTFFSSGGVSIGNTTDLGAGTLNVTGNISTMAATTANQVPIKAQLDLKADITNTLLLTGNQTFTGVKSATSTSGSIAQINLTNTSSTSPLVSLVNNLSNGNAQTIYNNGGTGSSGLSVNSSGDGIGILAEITTGSSNTNAFKVNVTSVSSITDAAVFNVATSNNLTNFLAFKVNSSNVAVIDKSGNIIGNSITLNSVLKLKAYTVATLPTGAVGDMAYVTDATAPTYNGTLTGGGAVKIPVFYDGTAWKSH